LPGTEIANCEPFSSAAEAAAAIRVVIALGGSLDRLLVFTRRGQWCPDQTAVCHGRWVDLGQGWRFC
jgi:uracil-DNA glycosylase